MSNKPLLKTIQARDLVPGDTVIADGQARTVSQVKPRHRADVFSIWFTDGTLITCRPVYTFEVAGGDQL